MTTKTKSLSTIDWLILEVAWMSFRPQGARRSELISAAWKAGLNGRTVRLYLGDARWFGHVDPADSTSKRRSGSCRAIYFRRVGYGKYALSEGGRRRFGALITGAVPRDELV